MTILNIFSKNIISNNTICQKHIVNFLWNKWKYRWNETDDEILPVFASTISLNLQIYFLKFPWKIVFSVNFRQLLVLTCVSLALRKCKMDCKIPKTNLVQGFCPLKTEIAWFPIGFCLNCHLCFGTLYWFWGLVLFCNHENHKIKKMADVQIYYDQSLTSHDTIILDLLLKLWRGKTILP